MFTVPRIVAPVVEVRIIQTTTIAEAIIFFLSTFILPSLPKGYNNVYPKVDYPVAILKCQ